jgi:hypothetical protein
MTTADVSREGTDFRKRYKGVRLQQGRLLTDDDFNDAMRIDAEGIRRTHLDVIGPVGSPDGGFLPIVPAAPLPVGSGVQFTISPGSLYLGGLRLEQRVAEAFPLQKDWVNFDPALHQPALPVAGTRTDLVWIEAWEQPVSAVEDSEKFEVALGSADTAMSVRTIQRVAVFPGVNSDECPLAWAQATAAWAALGTMAPDMELATQAHLKVTFTAPAVPADLCSPAVAGGYLGAENQAIRVQIVTPTTYTWGYDNASPLYRVQVAQVLKSGVMVTQVTLLTEPKDAVHWPLKGQIVEILPWSAALPNGEVLAELNGLLARVTATYNPDDQTLEIDTPLPAGFGTQWTTRSDKADFFDGTPLDNYYFLRVWNRGDDIASPPAIPVGSGDLGTTGLHIAFIGGPLRPCDHWIIAARPAAPDAVTPWLLEAVNGAPPVGVKHYRAPLALIRWTVTGAGAGAVVSGVVIHDCRNPFVPLTKLRGCCTVTVGDGTTSFGMYTSIQKAINALPQSGGTVCVLPGTYDESVTIANRSEIVIHGCDARARVRAGLIERQSAPAFLIVDSQDIAIERLGIESGPRSAVEILRSRRVAVRHCVIQMRDIATLYQAIFARGDDLVIEGNLIDNLVKPAVILAGGPGPTTGVLNGAADGAAPPPPPAIADATRGGIQLGGGCERVKVLDNVIRGGIWNGITLGSVRVVGGDDDSDEPDKPTTFDPCFPCRPVDTTEEDDDPDVRIISAGDLYDIEIRGNTIEDMGANGIAVVRFFNVAKLPILVGVRGLHIESNLIRRCLRRAINPPPQAMQWFVAYGGITLAHVTDLRVIDNEITRNGVDHLEPVCGVFALIAENALLERNRIIDNGPRGHEPPENAKVGLRGGIWIWVVRTGSAAHTRVAAGTRRFSGAHAAVLRDNLVIAPVGRALTLFCAGPLEIARNRLVSQGTTGRDLEALATAVLVGNLGISNEWTFGLALVIQSLHFGKAVVDSAAACNLTMTFGLRNPATGALWPPLTASWPTGKSLFTENQVTTHVVEQSSGLHASSILLFSFDDVGFTDNQCEVESMQRWFLSDALLLAGSVRAADNRFAETWLRAFLSAWTVGLMNTTTDNQSTHCMAAHALLGDNMRVFRDNLMLVTDSCPGACGRFGAQDR